MRPFVRAVTLSSLLAFPVALPAHADDMSEALDGVCQKMRGCALAQMEGAEGMSEQTKAMIETQLDSMCDGIKAQYNSFAASVHPLYKPATACLVSMEALTCEQISEGDENPTPECAELREKAEAYE